jgi:hypothetical protein
MCNIATRLQFELSERDDLLQREQEAVSYFRTLHVPKSFQTLKTLKLQQLRLKKIGTCPKSFISLKPENLQGKVKFQTYKVSNDQKKNFDLIGGRNPMALLSETDQDDLKQLSELQERMHNCLAQLDNTLFIVTDPADANIQEQFQPDLD